jgi:hypothetical protein
MANVESEIETLREALAEAVQLAQRIGDDVREEPPGVGYLDDPQGTIEMAIERMALHEGPISLFVGAGVSMEAGLPSWPELLRRLLEAVARDLDETQRERWLEATLSEGPLAAAAIARSLYPEDEGEFRRALRSALYGSRRPRDFAPGALAGQVAWLKRQFGERLHVLTVNYDGLLEAALDRIGMPHRSYVRAWREPDGNAAVWHLHGRLMTSASGQWLREGNLVLSEVDYVKSTYGTWPQEHVAARLTDSLCVFVGLSMADPNFVRWLVRHGDQAGHEHLVLFVRQAAPELDDPVRMKLEASATARWSRYGVRPIWTNYYGEVAQLLHEVGLRRIRPGTPGFHERARSRLHAGREALAPDDGSAFHEAQQDACAWLRQRLREVRRIAADAGADLVGEDLGIGLWGVDHANGTIELWATSDRALLTRAAIVQRPLHVFSRWVAVAALTQGSSVEQDVSAYTIRWRFVRAIPVVVAPMVERSVVGVITLTSTAYADASSLSRRNAPVGLLAELDRLLSENAAEFFTA